MTRNSANKQVTRLPGYQVTSRTLVTRCLCVLVALLFLLSYSIPFEVRAEDDSQKMAALNQPSAGAVSGVLPLAEGMAGKISLDLRNIEVIEALKFLSMKASLSIITTKGVAGRVTLMVDDAPVNDVFDLMLRSNNLAYDKKGNIYNVMTEEEYRGLYGKKFSDIRQVRTFRLKYAIPEQVFSVLDMLKSEVGRVLVSPESGDVFIMDSPARIAQMEEVLDSFEEKNMVKVFQLNYAKAKNVEEQLKTQLDAKKAGSIKADEQGNRLIVQTLPERMDEIERLIRILDDKTRQIIIDTQIIKVKLSNETSSGVNWEGIFDLGRRFGTTYLGSYPFSAVQAATDVWRSRRQVLNDVGYPGSYPFSGTTSSFSSSQKRIATEEMHLGVVGKHDFDTFIKYLATLGETRIISNPKLSVVNNQEAKIHVGSKEAYVTTTTTAGGSGPNTISEQVTFVDVGVVMNVVPDINKDGYITLKLKVEISSVIDVLVTPSKNEIPIIDTSLAETTVMMKDGSTIVIGGLRKDEKTKNSTQTPFLGSIPVLGKLFSVKSKKTERNELMIILTPRVITGDVLVDSSGKEVGKQSFKGEKEYLDFPKKNEAVLPSETFIPLEQDGMALKGMRPK